MKHASKKSWLLVSVLGVSALALPGVLNGNGSRQVKEDTLAGLRPGKDTIEKAYKRFGEQYAKEKKLPDGRLVWWRDECNDQELTLFLDQNGAIQTAAVARLPAITMADCGLYGYSRKARAKFGSGRGLVFRDRCDRIEEIYGPSGSKNSSANAGEQLESYLYHYDWGGKRAPLTLEVTCNVSENHVDRITLAVSGIPLKP